MSLVHWNPIRELSMFDTRFDRVFRDAPLVADEARETPNWVPAVDIYETDDHALVVSADLPGIDRENVSVTLEDGVLTISGERPMHVEVGQGRRHRSERAYGAFKRSFRVPAKVDVASVTAEHKDGTLRVRLALQEEAKPQRITVNAA
jgi:HSP20 family protein